MDKKALLIGDPHVRPQDLDECKRLIEYCGTIAKETKVDWIIILGDGFHTFDVINSSVAYFWEKAFNFLSSIAKVIYVLGNHDFQLGNKDAHALRRYNNITVIDDYSILDNVLFVSYQSNNNRFVEICQQNSNCGTVICHQSFNAAQYDNGFYIKDGINLEEIPQNKVISGHIHKYQELGKLLYTGSPRWLTRSDANILKYVWLTDFKDVWHKLSTVDVCNPIWHYVIKQEDNNLDIINNLKTINDHGIVTVDLHGDLEFINLNKKVLENQGVKIRVFPKKTYINTVRESEGIINSFNKFISIYKPPNGTNTDRLQELVKNRFSW